MGRIRYFTSDEIQYIRRLIKEEEENKDGIFNAIKDQLGDLLTTNSSIIYSFESSIEIDTLEQAIKNYHKDIVDNEDITDEQFDIILQKVFTVDEAYGIKMQLHKNKADTLSSKIINFSLMLDPSVITTKPSKFNSYLNTQESIYDDVDNIVTENINIINDEIDPLTYIDTFGKTFGSYALGIGVALVGETVGGIFGLGEIVVDTFTGDTTSRTDELVQAHYDYIANSYGWIDKGAYYNSINAMQITDTLLGIAEICAGVAIMVEGIAAMGAAIGSTAVLAVGTGGVGAAAGLVVVPAAAAVFGSGFGVAMHGVDSTIESVISPDRYHFASDGTNIGKAQKTIKSYDTDYTFDSSKVNKEDGVPKTVTNNQGEDVTILNGKLAGQEHPVTGIKFDENGFPEYDVYASVKLDESTYLNGRDTHFRKSNIELYEQFKNDPSTLSSFPVDEIDDIIAELSRGRTPFNYTWHHNQNNGVMELVNRDIHSATGHTGGYSIWGPGN